MRTVQKVSGVLLLAVVALLGWWLTRGAKVADTATGAPTSAADVLYWYDPMRPEVKFDKPGPSPFMDMALVPKYRGSADEGGISVNSRMSQNLGVRVLPAAVSTLAPQVTVTGTVAVDERQMAVLTTRAGGWIESLDVRATGDPVQRGQRIGGLYSPDVLAAEEEYLLALRSDDQALIPAARRRLELLGVLTGQLERIARRRSAERQIDLVAPITGVVTELLVRDGSAVTGGMPLMSLADLSRVWVLAEVPESLGAWLKPGQAAEVLLAGVGTEPIKGRLDYLYPEVSATTRTLRVRIVVANNAAFLRPGMSARVTLQGEPRAALLVPTESLIRSGDRTAVILAEGEGQFRPVAVVAGAEQGEQTEILSGLKAGDPVVISGQFLIDSEANLRGALDRLLPGGTR